MRLRLFLILGLCLAGFSFLEPARGSLGGLMANAAGVLRRDGAPGVSIVVVVKGHEYFENAGFSNRAGAPVTENTIFETASISKILTTTLLGIEVAEGRKSLNDPITRFLHQKMTTEMRHVTLGMLATYTAGIPELPPALARLPSKDWGIESYPVSSFLKFISNLRPRSLPATRAYSDASIGFLGLCLGHMNLQTWESLEKEDLYLPLGMRDTAAQLDAEQQSRMAEGTKSDGSLADPWPFDPFVAADGVKSTAHDLGKFLAAELGRRAGVPARISNGMAIATKPRFSIGDGSILQALAWTWVPGEVHGKPVWIIMKGGNLVGFSCRMCLNTHLDVGVAILTNRPNLPTEEVATNLLEQIAQEENPASSVVAER